MTDAKVLLEVRVRTDPRIADDTWTPLALKEQQTIAGEVVGDWFKYTDPRFVVNTKAGARVDALYSIIKSGATQYLQTAVAPEVHGNAATDLLGVHCLGDDGAFNRATGYGAKTLTTMSGLFSYQKAQDRSLKVFYRWYTKANLSADGWLRATGFDPNGAVNSGDYRYILGINESDVPGFGDSPGEIRARAEWDKRRIEVLRRVAPNAKICIGGYAHGNPDFNNPDVCIAMRETYAPLYNAQDISNPDVFFNLHNYTRSIVSEGAGGAKASPSNWYGSGWYERRADFLFTRCGFDPRIRAIVSDETGGELGAGSFNWAGYTNEQFAFWCSYYIQKMVAPIVVNGVSYPSPYHASTIFQGADAVSGEGGHWGGYYLGDGYMSVLRDFYTGVRNVTLLPMTRGEAIGSGIEPPAGYSPPMKDIKLAKNKTAKGAKSTS